MLKKLDKFSLPEIEEKVLEFWKTNKIFEKSLAKNAKPSSAKATVGKGKKFVFYEGPPTANGRPGIHHVLARSFKDIIPRFKTMAGFYVPRRAGWDTHGLPVELEVEKKLGLKSKKEIEKFGIAEFNKKCKESVWLYKDEWEKLTERMGFWLDLKNPYITYENSYIESVWNILKTVWDKKLLYKGHKVVPWCPRCGTGLSSHELALGYKEATDTSVYLKFRLKAGQRFGKYETKDAAYILSWTTTPWTLPGNVALAIGEKISYTALRVKNTKELYILASELVKTVFKDQEIEVVHDGIKGKDLLGLEYEPLFDIPALKSKTAYKIYDAKFVTTTDGTGVVHTAVMYGEDDYNLGKEIGLPQHHTVDEQGRFTKDVKGFEGMLVKSKDGAVEKETTDKILSYLKDKNYLLRPEPYTHEYPFCWRCSTPLIYYARDSWFISMSKLRAKLIAENKKINWVPDNIKNGRFGEWLKDAKDWAISRERYWGTPLPIWACDKCGKQEAIGSMEQLSKMSGGSNNRYILMRHGEAESNIKNIINSDPKDLDKYPLTLRGTSHVSKNAEILKKKYKIDMIFASDFLRAKETAGIIGDKLGLKVIIDKRLRELNVGIFDGKPSEEHWHFFRDALDEFTRTPPEGENLRDVAKRSFDFISELERKYKGKNILIVTHESVFWMMETLMLGWSEEESASKKAEISNEHVDTGDFKEILLLNLPRNENDFADLHKPFIDNLHIKCEKCGGKMERAKEVIDVWLDSGAMPFAQAHYPFDKKMDYPADYISEAMDQTRGWFYTLLAIGVLMGKNSPYKNVVCLGLIMDKNGQKMSKSKGNIVDPWEAIKKHGVDAIRWYFYTVNPPGEPKKFDEVEITKTSRQIFSLLYNSFVFLETYRAKNIKNKLPNGKNLNILDKWILSRLNETIGSATKELNAYGIGEAGRTIENFVGDLSRWYIRRSRRRFQKPDDQKDYAAASEVLNYALIETSKLTAPFAPFFSEALYKSLSDEESVHLADWPKADKKLINKKLSILMGEIRTIASNVLAKRAEVSIKVRQPLASLKLKDVKLKSQKELLEILKDEVNVKEIKFDAKLKMEFELDTRITHELKEEGTLRELIRTIQDLRQDAKLTPQDVIELFVDGAEEVKFIVSKYGEILKKEVKAKRVEIGRPPRFDAEIDTRIDEMPVWIGIKK